MRIDIDPGWRAWLVNDEIHAYCDEGWRELLHDLFTAFHDVLVHEPQARVDIRQVKEKFAGLRVYWREEDLSPACSAQLFATYRRFEDLSYRTCETCGRPGELRKRGSWYSTRCGDHLP